MLNVLDVTGCTASAGASVAGAATTAAGGATGAGGGARVEVGRGAAAGAGGGDGGGGDGGGGATTASMVTEGARTDGARATSDGSLGVGGAVRSSLIVVRSALVSTSIASNIGTGRSCGTLGSEGAGGTVVSTTGETCSKVWLSDAEVLTTDNLDAV